jgi:hypothetical protein
VRVIEDPEGYRRYRRARLLRGLRTAVKYAVFWVVVVAAIWMILAIISGPKRL